MTTRAGFKRPFSRASDRIGAIVTLPVYTFRPKGGGVTAWSWTAPADGTVVLALTGAGGGGAIHSSGGGNFSGGGGGGGYCRKTLKVKKGQTLSGVVGLGAPSSLGNVVASDGGDTTATLPDGSTMTAGGGKKGVTNATAGSATGGAGGTATGGDVNSPGGAGGTGTGNGAAGTNGGAGGLGNAGTNVNSGGGGGAGGDPNDTLHTPGRGGSRNSTSPYTTSPSDVGSGSDGHAHVSAAVVRPAGHGAVSIKFTIGR